MLALGQRLGEQPAGLKRALDEVCDGVRELTADLDRLGFPNKTTHGLLRLIAKRLGDGRCRLAAPGERVVRAPTEPCLERPRRASHQPY